MTMMLKCCFDYTNRQRIAFYTVGVGLALCIVGFASPFWISGEIVEGEPVAEALLQSFPRVDSLMGERTQTFDINVGLWWYCIGLQGREQMCFTYPPSEDNTEPKNSGFSENHRLYVMIVRTLLCACIGMALSGVLAICFYCTGCCPSWNTLVYGVLFFLAGTLGFIAVCILTFHIDVLPDFPDSRISYGWAFPVFLTGNSLITLASIVLCIPPSKKGGFKYDTIFAVDIPKHELSGQMGAFEPLPDPVTLTICKSSI